MKHLVACCLIAACLLLFSAQAVAAEPLNITAVNTRTGIVTARATTTGDILQFKVPGSMLRSLKIGQEVRADYRAKRATVAGVKTSFAIVNVRAAEPVGQPTVQPKAAIEAHPAEPVSQPTGAAQATIDLRPAEPVGEPQATSQAMSSGTSSNPLGSRSGKPPMKVGRGTENPGRGACAAKGGEWRCTTIATGSDPGPGDDLRSCVCINP